VVTVATALVRRPADRAFIAIAVESRAPNPKDARDKNAELMAAVRKGLKEARLPDEAVRTLSYYVEPEYDYVKGKQTLRGYAARNTIEARVDEMDRVGEIIDSAVTAGATSVGNPRFDLKDRDSVAREALKQAVAEARAKAEAAAAGAGRSVERVLGIEEQGVTPQPPPRPFAAVSRGAIAEADLPQTQVVPGEIEVRAEVKLTAELK
jgi:uncharacterized protein YggE